MSPVSLAPWTYRKLFGDQSPVLKDLSVRELLDTGGSRACFEAYAYLKDRYRPNWLAKPELYGDADGTGSGHTQSIACHKAISESLERWCFYESMDGSDAERLGFKMEPTTTGLAAFPNWSARAARQSATWEAIERWSVCAWWEGRIGAETVDTKRPGVHAISLRHPWSHKKVQVVILWQQMAFLSNSSMVYGFSCRNTLAKSTMHAHVEMRRNTDALQKYVSGSTLSGHPDPQERRLIFFSSTTGQEKFMERVQRSLKDCDLIKNPPRTVVDCEIVGPWSEYTRVWRILFEMPSDLHLEKTENYFMF